MRADLSKTAYETQEEYNEYIYGSSRCCWLNVS